MTGILHAPMTDEDWQAEATSHVKTILAESFEFELSDSWLVTIPISIFFNLCQKENFKQHLSAAVEEALLTLSERFGHRELVYSHCEGWYNVDDRRNTHQLFLYFADKHGGNVWSKK